MWTKICLFIINLFLDCNCKYLSLISFDYSKEDSNSNWLSERNSFNCIITDLAHNWSSICNSKSVLDTVALMEMWSSCIVNKVFIESKVVCKSLFLFHENIWDSNDLIDTEVWSCWVSEGSFGNGLHFYFLNKIIKRDYLIH